MFIDPIVYNGGAEGRLEKEMRCYALLDGLGLEYRRVDHEHADTIEACEAVEQVLGEKICKNLFLCNRQLSIKIDQRHLAFIGVNVHYHHIAGAVSGDVNRLSGLSAEIRNIVGIVSQIGNRTNTGHTHHSFV